MEIIAAILGALVAVFIGAYINHVLTWRIKNKVDALDLMYKVWSNIVKIIGDKIETVIPANYEVNNLVLSKMEECTLFMDELFLQSETLDGQFNPQLGDIKKAYYNTEFPELENLKRDNKELFNSKLYENLKKMDKHKLFTDIHNYRNEITKFSYMLKELFYNRNCVIAGIIIFIILICWLIFHCCNSTHSAANVINVFIS